MLLPQSDEQVSHPYKTTDKTVILYNLIFIQQNILDRMVAGILWA